jgi:filamentous hemagglutinin family protein
LFSFSPFVELRANPTGESVVAGSASFDRAGSSLTITTSHPVIINWQDFSIQSGELTKFVQPSAMSTALNRVVGGNPSAIYGTLQANGQVFLINPNGVLVGGGAVIDTAGFVATSATNNFSTARIFISPVTRMPGSSIKAASTPSAATSS